SRAGSGEVSGRARPEGRAEGILMDFEVRTEDVSRPEALTGHEWVNPIGPRACYDEGKRCAESLFFDYQRQHGTRIKVARIFNTYGPLMSINDGRVVSNLIV